MIQSLYCSGSIFVEGRWTFVETYFNDAGVGRLPSFSSWGVGPIIRSATVDDRSSGAAVGVSTIGAADNMDGEFVGGVPVSPGSVCSGPGPGPVSSVGKTEALGAGVLGAGVGVISSSTKVLLVSIVGTADITSIGATEMIGAGVVGAKVVGDEEGLSVGLAEASVGLAEASAGLAEASAGLAEASAGLAEGA